jgi:kynurenine formamidase
MLEAFIGNRGRVNIMPQDLGLLLNRMKVFDLEQPRFNGMPIFQTLKPGYYFTLNRRHEDGYEPEASGSRTSAWGTIFMMEHSGTHIDAISHQAYNLRLHGGLKVSPQTENMAGFCKYGADEIPAIVCRGVLLDVAASRGSEKLVPNEPITTSDLEKSVALANVKIQEGGAILVRTGYGAEWSSETEYSKAPGLDRDANLWIGKMRPRIVGIDNLSWDHPGFKDPETGNILFGHLHLIVEHGIYIIENMNLEELSKAKAYNFTFISSSIKIRGGTGAPVRPLALTAG